MKSKHLLFILFIGLLPCLIQAQGWERIYSRGVDEEATAIIPAEDGGYLLVGKARAAINSGQGARLVKLNANGQIQWTKEFQSSYEQTIEAVAKTADGAYVTLGNVRDGANSDVNFLLERINAFGEVEMSVVYDTPFSPLNLSAIDLELSATGGGVILCNQQVDENGVLYDRNFVARTNANGTTSWSKVIGEQYSKPVDLLELADGSIMVLSNEGASASTFADDVVLRKLDANGEERWKASYGGPFGEHATGLTATADGGFAITAYLYGGNHLHDDKGVLLYKVAADGTEEWMQRYDHFPAVGNGLSRPGLGRTVVQTADGGYAISGETFDYAPFDAFLIRTDANGQEIDRDLYRAGMDYAAAFSEMLLLDNGQFLMAGQIRAGQPNGFYLVLANADGHTRSNYIKGLVIEDANGNCEAEIWEEKLDGWKVKVTGNESSIVNVVNGRFEVDIDTGNYSLELIPPNAYWTSCPPQTIQATQLYDTSRVELGAKPDISCPQLSVEIAAGQLQACESTRYAIHYCNTGTIDASNAYIELLLDSNLSIEASSIPIAGQQGENYRFDIGDISKGDCNFFYVDARLDCNVFPGQTHCVNAHIYPDSSCLLPDPNWGGASLELNSFCENDSIHFEIENVGPADMGTSKTYIVIIDDVILRTVPFFLESGESTLISELSDGATLRLSTDQENGHPGQSRPSLAVEGCGGPPMSIGFVNQFPQDDDNSFQDIHCLQNRPTPPTNEMQPFPLGYEAEHFIEPDQKLEYLIRFKNTSADTIRRLVIRDTIDAKLDLASLEVATSSHVYDLEVYGDRVVQFTFNNIQLPPAATDPFQSGGFVKFSIGQRAGNQLDSVIRNQATIYYNYEAPVLTNEVFHTLGENFIREARVVSNQEPLNRQQDWATRPNPMYDGVLFESSKAASGQLTVSIYDNTGHLIRTEKHQGKSFWMARQGLTAGIYFYEIKTHHHTIARGKLLIADR